MNDRDRKLLTRAREALVAYVEQEPEPFENWPMWCLIDEIEEALTGITPATLL